MYSSIGFLDKLLDPPKHQVHRIRPFLKVPDFLLHPPACSYVLYMGRIILMCGILFETSKVNVLNFDRTLSAPRRDRVKGGNSRQVILDHGFHCVSTSYSMYLPEKMCSLQTSFQFCRLDSLGRSLNIHRARTRSLPNAVSAAK